MPKAIYPLVLAFAGLITAGAGADTIRTSSGASAARTAGLSKDNVTREGRSAWRKVIRWPDGCEEGFDYPDPNLGGMAFYPLGRQRYLVEVVCTLGAYQGYQRYYVLDESKNPPAVVPLAFTTFEATGERGDRLVRKQSEELWGTPEFDPETRRLTVLNRFRGTGDCGTLSVYVLEQGRPQLKEVRAKVKCDGHGADNPKSWPKLSRN
jgi:Protein of unknown function (DUF1176)